MKALRSRGTRAIAILGMLAMVASTMLALVVPQAAFAVQPVPGHTTLPPETPRTNVPRITSGEITDLEYIGNRVFIAGTFTSIRNNAGNNTTSYNQRWLASYNIDTGLVDTGFRPTFGSGGVTEIEASPDGTRLYVVGRFNTVNGVTKRKVAALNPTTGATITGFTANANAAATSVDATNTTVYIGGQFTTINNTARVGLAAVNASNGSLVANFVNNLSGGIGVDGALSVQALVLTHDESKLLVVHTGRQIDGQDRYGMGLIDTQTNDLLPWRSRLWDDNLQFVGGVTRIYAGAIAPDDSYFVVSSGSGGDRPPISDTAVAYPMTGGDFVEPLWISRAFDSVYSLAISEQAVFIGGHMNYVESPTAPDPWPGLTDQGYGRGQGLAGYGLGDDIVIRDHIAAISPATGKALEWDPGSNSFEGNKAMLVTPRGLFAGGDATTQGGQNVGRVAFYDFNSVPNPNQNETTITSPIKGRVEPADEEFVVEGAATATSGVRRVRLEVLDRDTRRYLQDNLTTWGNANTIEATVAAPNATSTTWSLPLTISGNRRLQLQARTFGLNGTSDNTKAITKIETFGLADDTPTTSVSGPSGSIIPTTTFTLTGSAQDDVGVNSIRFSFRDAQNRYLQNDGTVDAIYNTFSGPPDVVGSPSTTWSYEVTVPYEGEWTVQAIAVDTAGQSDLRSADRSWLVSSTAVAPTVAITAPAVMNPPTAAFPLTLPPGNPLMFAGSATDDQSLNYVEIRLRNTATRENLGADGTWGEDVIRGWHRITPFNVGGTSVNWSYTTPFDLVPGPYEFEVRAVDNLDLSTSSANTGRLTVNVQVPGDAYPDGLLDVTGTLTGLTSRHLDLTGRATDDIGVSAVRLTIRDRDTSKYLQPDGTMLSQFAYVETTLSNPGSVSTNFSRSVDLPINGDYDVTAFAFDTSNQQDPSTTGATARYQVFPGDNPPTVTENLLAPTEGGTFTDGRIFVSGRVEDDVQIAQAGVAVRDAFGRYLGSNGTFTSTTISWRTAFLNSPGSPGSNFSYTTPLIPAGGYTVLVRGVDQLGQATPVPSQRAVTVTTPVNNPPVANYTMSCVENKCTFDGRSSTDENPTTLTYAWTFGTLTNTGPVPTRTFTSAGTYTGILTVKDEWGLTASTAKTFTIAEPAGNLPPVPVINPPSCAARFCNISGIGSADPNVGDAFSYLWNFGDGTATSTASANGHTFPADGAYTVTLITTDGWGKAASTTRTITIGEPVDNAAPNPVISNPSCTARTCSFSGLSSSDPNGDSMTFLWNFGDATPTNTASTPTHAFAADGTYTVTLTVTDAWGDAASVTRDVTIAEPVGNLPPNPVIGSPTCVKKLCTFSAAGSSDPDGDGYTYLWNFGDATPTSTSAAPSHTFPTVGTFTVTLTLTDGWGDAGSTTLPVTITEPLDNVAPVPVINNPSCTARTCTFSSVGTADPNGDAFTYSWNFGDGSPANTTATPTKTYAADGDYVVTLTTTDEWGRAASVTRNLTIAKPAGNTAPTPVITAPTCAARTCVLSGISSTDAQGDAITFSWNFGDGSAASTLPSPTKTYTADGTYTVTLTTTDAWGDSASTTTTITLTEPVTNVAPTPVIGAPSCAGLVCVLSGLGSSDPNGDPFTYSWNFGDGSAVSTLPVPTKTYALAGTYTVTLTVTDGWGKTANTSIVVTVP